MIISLHPHNMLIEAFYLFHLLGAERLGQVIVTLARQRLSTDLDHRDPGYTKCFVIDMNRFPSS